MERSVAQVPSNLLPAFHVSVTGAELQSEREMDPRASVPEAVAYYGALAVDFRARRSLPEPVDEPEQPERADLLTLD